MAMSAKSASGCSYITHMIFAASMGDPPPRAMMVSGLKDVIWAAPCLAQASVGSLGTSKKQVYWMPSSVSLAKIGSAAPVL